MQNKKNPVPVWKKQEPPPGPGLNLLKPFSKEDFPKTQQANEKPPFNGTK